MDLLQLGVKNLTPYQYISRANSLAALEFYDQAKEETEEALRIIPDYVEAYKLSGRILLEQGEYEKSFENLRKAKILDPYDMEIRYYLARVFYELNLLQEAEDQCRRVLDENPKNEKAQDLLSSINNKKRNVFHE